MVPETQSYPMAQERFSGTNEHLNAMLGWLHRLLAWQITLTRQTYGTLADDEYRGLYVPDAEVEILSAGAASVPLDLAEQRAELAAERAAIEARALAAARFGLVSPLLRVGQLFNLTSFERDVLLLALAPEIDLHYERLYAYIQDDVTRKRPAVDLALRLLCADPKERVRARAAFLPTAPLLHHRLIQMFEDGQRQPPLLARFIKLDDRIVAELLQGDAQQSPDASSLPIDPLLIPYVTLTHPTRSFDDLVLPLDLVERLRQTRVEHSDGLVLALQGTYGSGRRAVAEALCADAGIPLLTVHLDPLVENDPDRAAPTLSPAEGMRRILREATLQRAAIFWQAAGRLLQEDASRSWQQAFLGALDEYQGRSFLALEQPWEARGTLGRSHFLRVALPMPSYTEREQLWRLRLNGDSPDDTTLQALASTFRLSGGQIRDAAAMARSLGRWRVAPINSVYDAPSPLPLAAADLYAACRAQSSGKLDSLAHKINATYMWNDIVLPADQLGQLGEICIQVRHRRTVLESWGFDKHLAMGKGVNVLFAGQSGTGKTMAAEIIAADLGLELYKVDLSTMVSKYIGETEKNLDRVFTAAREANAILFFDEADAIFGKRSEVKDAHDRYANIEVGYLLQKMEEYDGVVILATNLRKNLDDAFIRRLHVAIDFPFPEEPDRLRIWRKVFPPEAPLAEDVDLAFLAKQFKVAGGNIRNIALLSAYLAAEDGAQIRMTHIVRALKREYQKLGKLVTEAEFGRYLAMVRTGG